MTRTGQGLAVVLLSAATVIGCAAPAAADLRAGGTVVALDEPSPSGAAGIVESGALTLRVSAGTLFLTAGGPAELRTPRPGPGGSRPGGTASAELAPVTVTDLRAGSPGWVVTGVASDFVTAGGGDPIPAAVLGWVPRLLGTGDGQVVTAGPAAPGADPATPVNAVPQGLAASRVLAGSPAGSSVGTALVTAALSLTVPAASRPGGYASTLTLTAL